MDTHYADDITFLVNTPTQAKPLPSPWAGIKGIGLHLNADKLNTYFNQEGDIATLNGGSLKLVDQFTYFSSSISSTESDIDMCWVKA